MSLRGDAESRRYWGDRAERRAWWWALIADLAILAAVVTVLKTIGG